MIRFALAFSLLVSPAFAQSLFPSSAAAQAHCPQDVVVWLNTSRQVYRLPGQRGYGRAKMSSFACQKEADAAGDRLKKFKPRPSTGAVPNAPQ